MQSKEVFNSEPVKYCARCNSLRILDGGYADYCDKCGHTNILECSIEEWEALYEERYGKPYLNKE